MQQEAVPHTEPRVRLAFEFNGKHYYIGDPPGVPHQSFPAIVVTNVQRMKRKNARTKDKLVLEL